MSRRSSPSSSLASSLASSSDDVFFRQFVAQRMAAQSAKVDPHAATLGFLATTKVPYAIIGGQAAAYHISREQSLSQEDSSRVALMTNDIDVLVRHEDGKRFVEALQRHLNAKASASLHEKIIDGPYVTITLIGTKRQGLMDSVVDVHTLKPAEGARFPATVVRDPETKLVYANLKWVCDELAYSMRNHASADEPLKALKRQKRHALLNCKGR